MSKKVTRLRGERGSRRMSMDGIRKAMEDRRFWVGIGLVYVPNGEADRYEIDPDLGVLVHVKLMPDQEPLLCRLGGLGEGNGGGAWRVPPAGSEVAVGMPGGALENDPMILGVLSSGGVPSELDGDTFVVRAPKVTIVATSGEVLVQSAGGTPDALVTKTEFMAHVHTSAASGSPTSTPTVSISGTTVLKGE